MGNLSKLSGLDDNGGGGKGELACRFSGFGEPNNPTELDEEAKNVNVAKKSLYKNIERQVNIIIQINIYQNVVNICKHMECTEQKTVTSVI